jgi:hypothetical protein
MHITDHQLGFASKLVPLVKSGEKYLTYRLGERWDFLNVGDTIETKDSGTEETFGTLEILGKERTTFKEIEIDREGHEHYKDHEEKRNNFINLYNRPVEDSETVIILKFKVVNLTN